VPATIHTDTPHPQQSPIPITTNDPTLVLALVLLLPLLPLLSTILVYPCLVTAILLRLAIPAVLVQPEQQGAGEITAFPVSRLPRIIPGPRQFSSLAEALQMDTAGLEVQAEGKLVSSSTCILI